MQHAADLFRLLLFQDGEDPVVGVPVVDDERQCEFARHPDEAAEHLFLGRAGGAVAEEVEPHLADGDDLRVVEGELAHRLVIRLGHPLGVVGVDADRAVDVIARLCEFAGGDARLEIGADRHDGADTRLPGARHHLLEIFRVLAAVYVRMAVDQFHEVLLRL